MKNHSLHIADHTEESGCDLLTRNQAIRVQVLESAFASFDLFKERQCSPVFWLSTLMCFDRTFRFRRFGKYVSGVSMPGQAPERDCSRRREKGTPRMHGKYR